MKEETKRKISESHKGIRPSEETRKKMSLAKIGHIPWNKGLKGFGAGNKHAFLGDKAGKNAGNRRAQTLFKDPKPCRN